MIKLAGAVAIVFIAASAPAVALTNGADGELNLGYVSSSGNSESESLTLSSKVSWGDEHGILQKAELKAFSGSQDGRQSAEKYFLAYQLNRSVSDAHSVFGRAAYDDDRFSGYDYQATMTLGWAALWTMSGTQKLDTEVGLGYRINKFDDGDQDEEPVLRLAADYSIELTDNTSFEQSLSSEIGDDTTISKSASDLRVAMSDVLIVKLSLNLKHYSKPLNGNENLDRVTTVSIGYKF